MITAQQTADLAKKFQIDIVTICREYLQLVFLNVLYQKKESDSICFKGGTAIRLLLNSPRFSEDLDFETIFQKKDIKFLIEDLEKTITQEMPELKIVQLYSGIHGMRFRILLNVPFLKFPLVVRLDFTHVNKLNKAVSRLQTVFPIIVSPLIYHQPFETVLQEKLQAVVEREKGRDIYDILYLLQSKVSVEKKRITKNVLDKINAFPQAKLDSDLRKFLSEQQRKIIPILKEELLKDLNLRIHTKKR
ncbi:MAG: nucleotidyl transferase AbiEii/AbiGii toxin family protein [Patescibacteria group bacterium]